MHILAKAQHINNAREVFRDMAMTISEEGKRYLGGAMGTATLVEQFVQWKVEG